MPRPAFLPRFHLRLSDRKPPVSTLTDTRKFETLPDHLQRDIGFIDSLPVQRTR